jgi:hypothetical protein
MEEVVENEVASDAGGGLNVFVVLGEEAPNISELEDEEDEPGAVSRCRRNSG